MPRSAGSPSRSSRYRWSAPEIVGIAQLGPQLLEKLPVASLALLADDLDQMAFQVVTDGIVVEQGLVDIDQKNTVRNEGRVMG